MLFATIAGYMMADQGYDVWLGETILGETRTHVLTSFFPLKTQPSGIGRKLTCTLLTISFTITIKQKWL